MAIEKNVWPSKLYNANSAGVEKTFDILKVQVLIDFHRSTWMKKSFLSEIMH